MGQKETKEDKKGQFYLVKFQICSKKNRDIKGQKGTILFSQFHLFRRNKWGQKGTKEDKKGQIYSVNFIVHSYKLERKGTKEDIKGHFYFVKFLVRSQKNQNKKGQKGT